jgi:hypothetical protein
MNCLKEYFSALKQSREENMKKWKQIHHFILTAIPKNLSLGKCFKCFESALKIIRIRVSNAHCWRFPFFQCPYKLWETEKHEQYMQCVPVFSFRMMAWVSNVFQLKLQSSSCSYDTRTFLLLLLSILLSFLAAEANKSLKNVNVYLKSTWNTR